MSHPRPTGTSRRRNAPTRPISTPSATSRTKWFNLFSKIFMPRLLREGLQNRRSGLSFRTSLMNDFPTPEDPPVMTTEEKGESASLSEDTTGSYDFFSRPASTPVAFQTNPYTET